MVVPWPHWCEYSHVTLCINLFFFFLFCIIVFRLFYYYFCTVRYFVSHLVRHCDVPGPLTSLLAPRDSGFNSLK